MEKAWNRRTRTARDSSTWNCVAYVAPHRWSGTRSAASSSSPPLPAVPERVRRYLSDRNGAQRWRCLCVKDVVPMLVRAATAQNEPRPETQHPKNDHDQTGVRLCSRS